MYRLLRPLLFALDAELSHDLRLGGIAAAFKIPGVPALMRRAFRTRALPVQAMGLTFPNPIGLAAGLDKNGRYLGPLSALGFGWLEIGTVTPRPQPGNAPKRLFRVAAREAIVNRMGFNNDGVAALVANLRQQTRPQILGINIGKNRDTSMERAIDDYVLALRAVAPHADYVAVNISSPNTANLRALQEDAALGALLAALKAEQALLRRTHGRYVPIALKIAPDLDAAALTAIARTVRAQHFDAVIATNTTVTRPGLDATRFAEEAGGLSGAPLRPLATAAVRTLYAELRGEIPIIGVGGIDSPAAAWERLLAGADLLQIYTGLIYRGPGLVKTLVRDLHKRSLASGAAGDLAAAVRAARMNLSSE